MSIITTDMPVFKITTSISVVNGKYVMGQCRKFVSGTSSPTGYQDAKFLIDANTVNENVSRDIYTQEYLETLELLSNSSDQKNMVYLLLYECDDENFLPVGVCLLCKQKSNVLRLSNFGIIVEKQRLMGLESKLLEMVKEYVIENGFDCVTVECFEDEEVYYFAEQCGFKKSGYISCSCDKCVQSKMAKINDDCDGWGGTGGLICNGKLKQSSIDFAVEFSWGKSVVG